MFSAIFEIVGSLVKAVGAFFSWKQQRDLIDAGHAEAQAEAATKRDAANAEALAARETVRGDLARDPGGVLRDDGFKRD